MKIKNGRCIILKKNNADKKTRAAEEAAVCSAEVNHDHNSHDHHDHHEHSDSVPADKHDGNGACSGHEHSHKPADGHAHTHSHAEGSSHKNIFAAFILNLTFVIIELAGGLLTNSFAILSDAVHDMGDCLAIGCAWVLERKSKKAPKGSYTYGYRRYSVISALVTALVLVAGSVLVISSAVEKIINPGELNAKGMIIIAVIGVLVNGAAVLKTHSGKGVNERMISLHMLEDVLGWVVVLIGSVCIWLFDLPIIDPILSVCVAIFVLYHAIKNVCEVMSVLLEKAPTAFDEGKLRESLSADEHIVDIHHVHVWTLDGENMLATMHAVVESGLASEEMHAVKEHIRSECAELGIGHVTIEIDDEGEACGDCSCRIHEMSTGGGHHHHHHH